MKLRNILITGLFIIANIIHLLGCCDKKNKKRLPEEIPGLPKQTNKGTKPKEKTTDGEHKEPKEYIPPKTDESKSILNLELKDEFLESLDLNSIYKSHKKLIDEYINTLKEKNTNNKAINNLKEPNYSEIIDYKNKLYGILENKLNSTIKRYSTDSNLITCIFLNFIINNKLEHIKMKSTVDDFFNDEINRANIISKKLNKYKSFEDVNSIEQYLKDDSVKNEFDNYNIGQIKRELEDQINAFKIDDSIEEFYVRYRNDNRISHYDIAVKHNGNNDLEHIINNFIIDIRHEYNIKYGIPEGAKEIKSFDLLSNDIKSQITNNHIEDKFNELAELNNEYEEYIGKLKKLDTEREEYKNKYANLETKIKINNKKLENIKNIITKK